ncbi:hypothetical protein [Actinacidiphila sp. bgisy160]|uniref:hypothetical protein n=1 Tax=Actinacidiphila sp. bgisy160 TaxID=3413796 RepID=UPI003D7225B3
MTHAPVFDVTSPEGMAIAGLYADLHRKADSGRGWDAWVALEVVGEWLTGLGIDIEEEPAPLTVDPVTAWRSATTAAAIAAARILAATFPGLRPLPLPGQIRGRADVSWADAPDGHRLFMMATATDVLVEAKLPTAAARAFIDAAYAHVELEPFMAAEGGRTEDLTAAAPGRHRLEDVYGVRADGTLTVYPNGMTAIHVSGLPTDAARKGLAALLDALTTPAA